VTEFFGLSKTVVLDCLHRRPANFRTTDELAAFKQAQERRRRRQVNGSNNGKEFTRIFEEAA
jgi:hypothetical protein